MSRTVTAMALLLYLAVAAASVGLHLAAGPPDEKLLEPDRKPLDLSARPDGGRVRLESVSPTGVHQLIYFDGYGGPYHALELRGSFDGPEKATGKE